MQVNTGSEDVDKSGSSLRPSSRGGLLLSFRLLFAIAGWFTPQGGAMIASFSLTNAIHDLNGSRYSHSIVAEVPSVVSPYIVTTKRKHKRAGRHAPLLHGLLLPC